MELKPHDALQILESTPGTLRALLGGLSDSWLGSTEGPETFSPLDVLGHLIFGEETDWVPRMRIILDHGEARPFTPFDRLGFLRESKVKSVQQLLDRFDVLRSENLAFVRSLGLDEKLLHRTGTHPALGRVTLSQLLAAWAVHDLGHVKQVVRVMAKQYRDAVGPWREYLTILDRP